VPELTQTVSGRRSTWSLRTRAEQQLGTVGSGNHYVDLLVEPADGSVWAACHFGSRGFGHGVATGFLNLAAHRAFFSQMPGGESMHAAPSLLPLTADAAVELGARPQDAEARAEIGRAYERAMSLAGEYAYAGREHVIGEVLSLLGTTAEETVHNHHNYSFLESHNGETVHVVRKGATPAFPGQSGFIGGSMGDWAVVVEGRRLRPRAALAALDGARGGPRDEPLQGQGQPQGHSQGPDHPPDDGAAPERVPSGVRVPARGARRRRRRVAVRVSQARGRCSCP
jgi:RNA-splicing ligase RtcB